METKQTAMQELIQWLKSGWKDEDVDTVIKKAEKLLQMEKDQIVKAHNDGSLMAYTIPFNAPFIKGEEYYEENYGK
jgi:F0F1-type ATP synthase alpha subunit